MAKFHFFIVACICAGLTSCIKRDPKIEQEPEVLPSVAFTFQAKVKTENLVPDTHMYTNYSLDSFTVTKFNYYISNVILTSDKGTVYAEPESYHLIEHVNGKTSFNIAAVPVGNYTKIEFLIGVDSLRNVSGARTGDLDPANNMFWDWNQGYIFFKLEGAFNTQSQPQLGDYAIHIGGFKGPNSCLQKCSFDLINPITAKSGGKSTVAYNVQIDQIFVNPKVIDFDYYYKNISEATFKAISVNYRDMFVVDKIEN